MDGTYAYNFSGFSMSEGTPYSLAGIGVMTLKSGVITGEQRSSVAALKGQAAALVHTAFDLEGTYVTDGTFTTARVTFRCTAADSNGQPLQINQVLDGTFDFVPEGPDRFALISTGAHNRTADHWACEVMSGTAVRTRP